MAIVSDVGSIFAHVLLFGKNWFSTRVGSAPLRSSLGLAVRKPPASCTRQTAPLLDADWLSHARSRSCAHLWPRGRYSDAPDVRCSTTMGQNYFVTLDQDKPFASLFMHCLSFTSNKTASERTYIPQLIKIPISLLHFPNRLIEIFFISFISEGRTLGHCTWFSFFFFFISNIAVVFLCNICTKAILL